MTTPRPPTTVLVEELAREFHEVYQREAKRQGDVRHHDDYDALPENVKEFDRVLARHVVAKYAPNADAVRGSEPCDVSPDGRCGPACEPDGGVHVYKPAPAATSPRTLLHEWAPFDRPARREIDIQGDPKAQ